MSKSARYISSITNRTSVFGIMGGLVNRRLSGNSSMNRATSRLVIPPSAAKGLQYMRMHNLLSRNPQGSGGVGPMNKVKPCNCTSHNVRDSSPKKQVESSDGLLTDESSDGLLTDENLDGLLATDQIKSNTYDCAKYNSTNGAAFGDDSEAWFCCGNGTKPNSDMGCCTTDSNTCQSPYCVIPNSSSGKKLQCDISECQAAPPTPAGQKYSCDENTGTCSIDAKGTLSKIDCSNTCTAWSEPMNNLGVGGGYNYSQCCGDDDGANCFISGDCDGGSGEGPDVTQPSRATTLAAVKAVCALGLSNMTFGHGMYGEPNAEGGMSANTPGCYSMHKKEGCPICGECVQMKCDDSQPNARRCSNQEPFYQMKTNVTIWSREIGNHMVDLHWVEGQKAEADQWYRYKKVPCPTGTELEYGLLATSLTCSSCTDLDGNAGCRFKKNDNYYCCPGVNVSGGGCSDISNVCYIDNNDTSGCLANRFYQCPKSSCDASNSADIQKLLDSSNCYTVRAVGEFNITNTITIPDFKVFINDASVNVLPTFFSINKTYNVIMGGITSWAYANEGPLFLNKGAININFKSLSGGPPVTPSSTTPMVIVGELNIINKGDIVVDLADISDNAPRVIFTPTPIFNNYGTIEFKNINMNKLPNTAATTSEALMSLGNAPNAPGGYIENNGIIRFVDITYPPDGTSPGLMLLFIKPASPFTNNGIIQYDNIIAPARPAGNNWHQLLYMADTNLINTGHILVGKISSNPNIEQLIYTYGDATITNSGEICAIDQKAADVMCKTAAIVGTPCTLCASH